MQQVLLCPGAPVDVEAEMAYSNHSNVDGHMNKICDDLARDVFIDRAVVFGSAFCCCVGDSMLLHRVSWVMFCAMCVFALRFCVNCAAVWLRVSYSAASTLMTPFGSFRLIPPVRSFSSVWWI